MKPVQHVHIALLFVPFSQKHGLTMVGPHGPCSGAALHAPTQRTQQEPRTVSTLLHPHMQAQQQAHLLVRPPCAQRNQCDQPCFCQRSLCCHPHLLQHRGLGV